MARRGHIGRYPCARGLADRHKSAPAIQAELAEGFVDRHREGLSDAKDDTKNQAPNCRIGDRCASNTVFTTLPGDDASIRLHDSCASVVTPIVLIEVVDKPGAIRPALETPAMHGCVREWKIRTLAMLDERRQHHARIVAPNRLTACAARHPVYVNRRKRSSRSTRVPQTHETVRARLGFPCGTYRGTLRPSAEAENH